MRYYRKTLLILIVAITIASCKDDDNCYQPDPKPAANFPNYSKLEVGNYWVYERFTLKPNGEEISLNQFDSSYVEKDTLINGKTYFKLHMPSYGIKNVPEDFYLRDSLHYVVDPGGRISMSSQEFSVPLVQIEYHFIDSAQKDTLYSKERIMTNKDSLVNLSAGTFSTISSTEFIKYYGFFNQYEDRERKTLYVKDIGIVYGTLPQFTSNPNDIIQKLVRYKVK